MRSGIGARLRAGREKMGLTLLQVAEKLHVDPKALEAVEAERFGEFAAPVYVKGHLKRYSELVGENTQELLDLYSAAIKPVLPDLTQLPKASQHTTDPRKLVLPSLVVLIAFALVGTVWWVLQNVGKLNPPVTPQAVQTTSDESTTPVPNDAPGATDVLPPATTGPESTASANGAAPRGARTGAAVGGAAVGPNGAGVGPDGAAVGPNDAAVASTRGTRSSAAQPVRAGQTPAPAQSTASNSGTAQPQSPPVAGTGRGSGTRAGTTAGAASSTQITKATKLAATTPPATPEPEQPTRLKSIDVTLKFASDSWAEVYDANGQRLFYDIGSANSSHAVTGTPPLRVVLGNAPGVSVNINGRPAKVPASAVQNDSAQVTINRSGRIVRARPDEAASAASKPNGE
jgi:cytoskeleton protein RodZ